MAKKTVLYLCLALAALSGVSAQVTVASSIAMHGVPKYPDGFAHFDYVNPAAPKGGTLRSSAIGTYDNFNRFADRGVPATGSGAYFYDTLMTGSLDEPESYYPLVAEKIEYPADFSWIIFHLNPKARTQDGAKITADVVIFSFEKFMTEGVPQYRLANKGITAVALDQQRVKFTLPQGDKALALGLATLKILPKSFWSTHKLSDPFTDIPVGSGAYTVKNFRIGQYLEYERVPNYWGKDLPVNVGVNNFDRVRYDYYRDSTVAFEAFKAGEFDFYEESVAKNWATMYTGKQFDSGQIVKELISDESPHLFQAFVFNVQRPFFSDRRVRAALSYALDFEWLNKNYFYGQYTRSRSYFNNTDYEAKGLPSADELAVLNPIKDKIPAEVFTKEYQPSSTDGSGNIRVQLRQSLALLKEAGWEIGKDGKLANVKTGERMAFELLIYSQTTERIATSLQKNLERLGVTMTVRLVDTTQFTKRMRSLDYDMIWDGYPAFFYPSTELQLLWRSDYIDSTYNLAGVQDPTIDYLIDGIVARQEDEKGLLAWGRALDRVLCWNNYAIPMWYMPSHRVAYWNKFGKPKTVPKYDMGVDTWWVDTAKEAKLPKR